MKIRILAESKRVLVTLSLMAAIIIAVVCGVFSKCSNEDEQVGALSETEVKNVNRLVGFLFWEFHNRPYYREHIYYVCQFQQYVHKDVVA